ncbi:CHC2 zinc finger domain-containing protein [Vibrio alginolyticus]|uniref:CHC2 zinc finger domain-containing protein n=1 Tax=Vibrio alginolyticus TaxID=663 RepID=UPI000A3902BB
MELRIIFEVNDDHQHWHCWSDDCGGGDVFEALQKGHGMSFGKAVRYVADQIGYKLSLSRRRKVLFS